MPRDPVAELAGLGARLSVADPAKLRRLVVDLRRAVVAAERCARMRRRGTPIQRAALAIIEGRDHA